MKLKPLRAQRAAVARPDRSDGVGFVATLGVAMVIAAPGLAFASGDVVRGEQIYRNCNACHSPGKNGNGPMLDGIFGRKAGSVASYEYSAALKKLDIVWNSETLEMWLANPQAHAPWNKMYYRIEDPQDRADVIEFLKRKFEKRD